MKFPNRSNRCISMLSDQKYPNAFDFSYLTSIKDAKSMFDLNFFNEGLIARTVSITTTNWIGKYLLLSCKTTVTEMQFHTMLIFFGILVIFKLVFYFVALHSWVLTFFFSSHNYKLFHANDPHIYLLQRQIILNICFRKWMQTFVFYSDCC